MSDQLAQLTPQAYLDPRPREEFVPLHAWARTHRPGWMFDLLRLLVLPPCMLAFRARSVDSALVPGSGGVIIAPNHFSALDHFFVGLYLRRRVRFMAKSQLFRGRRGWTITRVGAFPVRRGRHDEEAIITAKAILARGGAVVIYPEGGRSRSGVIGERARPGVGRLALESGAPVVPVAIHGSQRARNLKRLDLPPVTVKYGQPLHFGDAQTATSLDDQQSVADEVLSAIRLLYDGL